MIGESQDRESPESNPYAKRIARTGNMIAIPSAKHTSNIAMNAMLKGKNVHWNG